MAEDMDPVAEEDMDPADRLIRMIERTPWSASDRDQAIRHIERHREELRQMEEERNGRVSD